MQRSRGVPLLQMAHHAARRGDCRRPVALQVRGSVNSSARQTGVHAATSVGGLGQGRCRATLAGQLWARLFGTVRRGAASRRGLYWRRRHRWYLRFVAQLTARLPPTCNGIACLRRPPGGVHNHGPAARVTPLPRSASPLTRITTNPHTHTRWCHLLTRRSPPRPARCLDDS